MLVFPQDGEPTMFVQYYNHLPNARHVSAIKDIRWGGIDIAATTANNLQERELAQSQIGIIGTISLKHYENIKQALPRATFIDFTSQMQKLRLIKSDEEIRPILRTRRTSAKSPESFIFRENMTIVIQPNVITIDERMGVQVGELVRVTRDGVESLHHYPMRFIRCG